jgi:hypothetical protein
MPRRDGQEFNWYHRYWHDWYEVQATVYEVAKAHARYLGYEVADDAYRSRWFSCTPPPGDLEAVGPVVRVELHVFRRTGKHRSRPEYEVLYVDVERRPGNKFHPKTAPIQRE